MKELTYRQKRRVISSICIAFAVLLAVILLVLVNDYNKKQREEYDRLFYEDIEQYEFDKELLENKDSIEQNDLLTRKQKKYDFYQKLTEHLQVNVLFLGNSAATDEGVSEQSNSWVMKIADDIRTKYGCTLRGGTYAKPDTTTFYGYHIMNSYSRGLTYDLMVVCYGAGEDTDSFEFYYDGLMRSIKNQNSKCEIYCVIEACESGKQENAEKIKEICDYYGGIVIDMNEYYAENNIDFADVTASGITPNLEGNELYYKAVSKAMNDAYTSERRVTSVKTARLESSTVFDDYHYTQLSDMKRISDTVYETSIDGRVAALIYAKSFSGGKITVYVNGKKLITEQNTLETNVSRRVASRIISSELGGVTKIRIETEEAANVANILGIAYCKTKK